MSRSARVLLCLALVAVSFVPAAGASAATCASRGTDGLVTRRVGLDTYSIAVPDGVPGKPLPLAVMLHGLAGEGKGFAQRTGWVPFARAHNFIVAFPSEPARTWIRTKGSPDVAFVRRVVAHIRATDCVDPHRIYVGGVSDGGYMSARLACDAPDLFAAVAVVAAADANLPGNPCTPSEPVAVAFFHGTADKFVSLSAARNARDAWIGRLRCSRTPTVDQVPYGPLEHFRGCSGDVEVMWRIYRGGPHSWPHGEFADDALARMWRFFSHNPD